MTAPATVPAFELQAGMTVIINGSQRVTIADVYHRDSAWIANGVVRFVGTDGHRYGVGRIDSIRLAH
jgi:hypothetical protein